MKRVFEEGEKIPRKRNSKGKDPEARVYSF